MPTLLQYLFVLNSQPQPAKVMVSLQKTSLLFRTAIQARDRFASAYRAVMDMQV